MSVQWEKRTTQPEQSWTQSLMQHSWNTHFRWQNKGPLVGWGGGFTFLSETFGQTYRFLFQISWAEAEALKK